MVSAVLAAIAWVHWPALSAQAKFLDDNTYIDENWDVLNPGWASVRKFFTEITRPTTVEGYYHPLTLLSLMLDYSVAGRPDNLRPFHQTNLTFHLATCALLMWLMYELFGHGPAAVAAGLLYGVHPLTVELVVWIAARKALLAMLFSTAALASYARFTRRGGRPWYILSLASFSLALLSKPTATVLPVLLLIVNFWPLRRPIRRAVLESIPFFALAGASGIVTIVSHQSDATADLQNYYSLGQLPLLMSSKLAFGLAKVFFPGNLSAYYAAPAPMDFADGVVTASVGVVSLLTVAAIVSLRRGRAIAASLAFYATGLVLVLGVVRYGAEWVYFFDNYLSLPMIGCVMLFAGGLAALLRGDLPRMLLYRRSLAAAVVVSALAAAEARAAQRYIDQWTDSFTLHRYMLRLYPDAFTLNNELANLYSDTDQLEPAIPLYEKAIAARPNDPRPYNNLAQILARRGKPGDLEHAIQLLQKSLEFKSDYPTGLCNLGVMLGMKGRHAEAAGYLERTLALKPDFPIALYHLGRTYHALNRPAEAEAQWQAAIALQPRLAEAHFELGQLYWKQGDVERAVRHFQAAVESQPDNERFLFDLARLQLEQGHVEAARAGFEAVLRLDPQHVQARLHLRKLDKGQ